MRKKNERHHLLTRRVLVLGGVKLAAVSTLIGRLYYLQFVRSDTYRTLAEDNRVNLQLIPPPRGEILDTNGVPMAENQTYYKAVLTKGDKEISAQTLSRMAELLEISPQEKQELDKQFAALWKGRTMTVRESLDWSKLSRLEFHTPDLPGAGIESGQARYYPFAEMAAHLIGNVGSVEKKDLEPNQPMLKLPGFKIGKSGVEKSFDRRLRGTAGLRHLEVNAAGLAVRELKRQEPEPGENIRLTLDSRLQEFCAMRLQGESGSVAVMRVTTGEVMALCTIPGFDPNRFSTGISHAYWKELNDNPKNPLINKAIAGLYPPGSTFKMLVGLAALEKGIANLHTHVYCPGSFYLGRRQFKCWKPGGHGSVNVLEALSQSCDVYFYTMAQRLGIEPIADISRRFGLGAPTGIAIPDEKGGVIPDPEWKRIHRAEPWVPGDTVNAGIGQGFVLTTPLQLAVMAARIANGEFAVSPQLTALPRDAVIPPLNVAPEHLDLIRTGMTLVVNGPTGTARGSKLPGEDFIMAGKTGTAQVRALIRQGVDQNTIPWEHRHHALFVAYAPAEAPRYAMSVVIEHGGGGASTAAPIARDIMMKIRELEIEGQKKEEEAHAKP